MALTVTNLSSLDQSLVTAQQTVALQLLGEYVPGISFKRGVMHDLVLHLNAILAAVNQHNMVRLLRSNSLSAINNDPTLATDSIVDNVLSNWGLTRISGAKASGTIVIKLSKPIGVIVPLGATFTINGLSFKAVSSYSAKVLGDTVTSDTDKMLTENTSDSTWSFSIEVEAAEAGAAGNVKTGTRVYMDAPVPKFSSAYVFSDFTGGVDEETNEELAARRQAGIGAKGVSGRANIDALVKDQFPETLFTSAIGFGDSEMIRDQHSLWPGSSGGRCDLYVKTAGVFQESVEKLPATLVSKVGSVGTWQIPIGRGVMPGFYEVARVVPLTLDVSQSGFSVDSDTRSFSLVGESNEKLPDVKTAAEAVYSSYQSATVTFVDNLTNAAGLAIGDSADYNVVFRHIPYIGDIQTYLNNPEIASPAGDILVKAAIPCFVSVTLTLNVPAGEDYPTEEEAAGTVSSYVGSLGFSKKLSAPQIAKKLHDAYPNLIVSDISLTGRLRKPDGTQAVSSSTNYISIVDDFDNMVSAKTAAFLLSPTDVSVNIVHLD